jgi:hypothetical protein
MIKVPYISDSTPEGNELGEPDYTCTSDLIVIPRVSDSFASGMRKGREYRYFLAYEYDKSQIGPLSDLVAKTSPHIDEKAIFVDVYFKASLLLNKRISGLYIFRSYTEGFVDADQGSTPRMVKYIDLSKTIPVKEMEGFGDTYYFVSAKDADALGSTFDSLAGYPSTQDQTTPYYSVSCVGQGYNFISGCGSIEGFKDATNYVFRSQPNRMDQFNLVDDFVILPERPKAMAFYNGKLYCFSSSRSWTINALGDMYIEDQMEGIGCENNESLIVTDLGFLVAGPSNIYLNMGNGFQPIGEPVLRSNVPGTGYLEKTTVPVVSFDEKRMIFLVFYRTSFAGGNLVLAFSPLRKRWDLWEGPAEFINCAKAGKNGMILLAGEEAFYNYLGGLTYRAYTWWTKVMNVGANTLKKIWYEIRVKHSATFGGTVTLSDEDSNSIPGTQSSGTTTGLVTFVPTSKALKDGISVHLSSIPGNCYIDSIGVIFRRKIGAR